MLFGHKVDALVEEGGRFVGCSGVVEADREPRADARASGINVAKGEFRAEGDCVVIAAGGIMGNLDLVRRLWPYGEPPELLLNGSHPSADGALHGVAERRGANVTHLDRMWLYAAGVRHWKPDHAHHGLSLVPPKSALWLNWRGEPFAPPAMVTGFDTRHLVQQVCAQERRCSWQVLNSRIARRELAVSGSEFNPAMRDKKRLAFLATALFGNGALVRELCENCPDFVVGASLSELASRMNDVTATDDIDADRLAEVVGKHDETIRRGRRLHNDDQLRRIAHARQYRGDRVRTSRSALIDDPKARPLIAIREQLTTRKSLGGIQTDLGSRVLGVGGVPMPGLYAVGEAAGFGGGGIHGIRSLEGTFLGGCILGGRAAARTIAED